MFNGWFKDSLIDRSSSSEIAPKAWNDGVESVDSLNSRLLILNSTSPIIFNFNVCVPEGRYILLIILLVKLDHPPLL